ncbi:DUF7946 domain-containing protein [Novosphingobium resinovorum]|uniref:DUF7946 domain-containing protein n=2 Tax=Sphingomonadaceae TaxID=41297 RepID=UPI0022F25AE3|nr:hypothetical protein [Novosphingobium resinovorum]
MTGDLAEKHQFEAYDGYTGLAGFARTLSLVANYVETGKIRQRGDFEGRHSIVANPMREGSLIADFAAIIESTPFASIGAAAAGISAAELLRRLTDRVFKQNLGQDVDETDLEHFGRARRGDVETLVAITEAPIRQTHHLVNARVQNINVISGVNLINKLNEGTKQYVMSDYKDDSVTCKDVTISSFNANSGYGSLFDFDLGRTVAFTMSRENLAKYKHVFSWGLDQYSNETRRRVNVCFSRTLWMDERAKRYQIVKASKPAD